MCKEEKKFSLGRMLIVLSALIVVLAIIIAGKHLLPQKVISSTNKEYTGKTTEAMDVNGKKIFTFCCEISEDYVNFLNNEAGIEILNASVRPHINRGVTANSYTVTYVVNESAEKHEYCLAVFSNETQYKDFWEKHSIDQVLDVNVLVDSNLLDSGETYYVTYFN